MFPYHSYQALARDLSIMGHLRLLALEQNGAKEPPSSSTCLIQTAGSALEPAHLPLGIIIGKLQGKGVINC
jgi:hypothetical protein